MSEVKKGEYFWWKLSITTQCSVRYIMDCIYKIYADTIWKWPVPSPRTLRSFHRGNVSAQGNPTNPTQLSYIPHLQTKETCCMQIGYPNSRSQWKTLTFMTKKLTRCLLTKWGNCKENTQSRARILCVNTKRNNKYTTRSGYGSVIHVI